MRRRWLTGLVVLVALLLVGFLAVPVSDTPRAEPPVGVWETLTDIAQRKRKAFDALLRGDTEGAKEEARSLIEGEPGSGSAR